MSSRNSSLCRHSLRVEYNKSIANCYLLTIVNSVEVGMVVVVVVEVGVSLPMAGLDGWKNERQ